MPAITISFMNNKGGCGKTTTACAVGQAWARSGKRILFVDLDSQANLTSIVTDTNPTTAEWENTIENVLIGGPDFIEDAILHVAENVDIIPADLELASFEKDISHTNLREFLLAEALDRIKDRYDFILLDCPPALSMIIYNALVASDYIVIVTTPDRPSYRGMGMISEIYEQVRGNKRLNPNIDILGIVITRYENITVANVFVPKIANVKLDDPKDVKKFVDSDEDDNDCLVVKPIIPKAAKIQASMSLQVSLYDYDRSGKSAQKYAKLSENLYRRVVEAERVKNHNIENK